ncbi:MAG TPA: glycoside hydrolase 43 family protein [Sphingomonas sp.]|nr:glycoside hydrolase 43 family protein [Sphingomonas sp.]
MDKIIRNSLAGLALLAFFLPPAARGQVWRADNGDGTFKNPILYADYPDADIIRVGADYYFASTTFVNVPGITILHSKDLVNWEFASHVITRLDGRPQYDMRNGVAYRAGSFAASLRYHDGVFYVANTPVGQKTRIYYTRNIRGPWRYHELDREAFDPGLFIDRTGTGYIATALGSGDGTITLLTLSKDFSRVIDARPIHNLTGSEGSKIIRRGDYYYLFNAIPRRLGLTVSRARNLSGPWETRDQIDDKSGGHQGALVDLPNGDWFGFVMYDAGSPGRMTNLSPIFWKEDWPVWGTPDAPGRVPAVARKPIQGFPFKEPAASDDFNKRTLGLQWQWNHNPDDAGWSLAARPGYLRLQATAASELWFARNSLTQKGQGPRSIGEIKVDASHMRPGDVCGFGTLGQFSGRLSINRAPDGQLFLSMSVTEDMTGGPKTETRVKAQPFPGLEIRLRTQLDFTADRGLLSYSVDGARWTPLGGPFPLAFAWRTGTFQGEQFAISCYNPAPSGGFIDVDYFKLLPSG